LRNVVTDFLQNETSDQDRYQYLSIQQYGTTSDSSGCVVPAWTSNQYPTYEYQTTPVPASSQPIYSSPVIDPRDLSDHNYKELPQINLFSFGSSTPDSSYQYTYQQYASSVSNPTWSTYTPQATHSSHLPTSYAHDNFEGEEEGGATALPNCPFASPPEDNDTQSKSPYKPAWGASSEKNSESASEDKRHSKRSTASDKDWRPTHRKSGSPTSFRQLRNSKPSQLSKFTSANSDSESGSSSRSSKGRQNHNLTEKKYRSKLNGQFETLLSALPAIPDSMEGYGEDQVSEKKISKAEGGCPYCSVPCKHLFSVSTSESHLLGLMECLLIGLVLVMAKDRIRALEKKREMLEGQKQTLKNDVEHLRGVLVSLGGEHMQ
jgi:hypothetical protein